MIRKTRDLFPGSFYFRENDYNKNRMVPTKMFKSVLKQGYSHIEFGGNCQDVVKTFEQDGYEFGVICDGCGSTKNSGIGAQMFVDTLENDLSVGIDPNTPWHDYLDSAFNEVRHVIKHLFGKQNYAKIVDYMSFTVIFMVKEPNGFFRIFHIGDGYWFSIKDGGLYLHAWEPEIPDTPIYPIYRYLPESILNGVRPSEVKWEQLGFVPEDYGDERFGIASDGLRFGIKAGVNYPSWDVDELESAIIAGKRAKVARHINSHRSIFKDDISIVW